MNGMAEHSKRGSTDNQVHARVVSVSRRHTTAMTVGSRSSPVGAVDTESMTCSHAMMLSVNSSELVCWWSTILSSPKRSAKMCATPSRLTQLTKRG